MTNNGPRALREICDDPGFVREVQEFVDQWKSWYQSQQRNKRKAAKPSEVVRELDVFIGRLRRLSWDAYAHIYRAIHYDAKLLREGVDPKAVGSFIDVLLDLDQRSQSGHGPDDVVLGLPVIRVPQRQKLLAELIATEAWYLVAKWVEGEYPEIEEEDAHGSQRLREAMWRALQAASRGEVAAINKEDLPKTVYRPNPKYTALIEYLREALGIDPFNADHYARRHIEKRHDMKTPLKGPTTPR